MTEIWEWFKALVAPLTDAVGELIPTLAAVAFGVYILYTVLDGAAGGSKGTRKGPKKPKGGDRR